jgi:phosphatidylglycerophosphate synthase
MTFDQLRNALQQGIYLIINPFVRLLVRLGFTPNAVTLTGLVLNMGVAVLFIVGGVHGLRGDLRYVGWGGALILFAGLFDMLDGQVARIGKMQSSYGALFDSVLDRYSELFTFLGICYYLVAHHYFLSSLVGFFGLIGSMMVSYTRARAEGLGIECKGGLMQRPERVVLMGVSALACGIASNWIDGSYKLFIPGVPFHVFETMSIFTFPLTALAVLANITAVSRLLQAKRALLAREAQPAARPAAAAKPVAAVALLAFGLLAGGLRADAAAPAPALTFPVPSGIPNQLFYLQRDPNAYGVKSKKIGPDKYELRFAAYGKLPFYLMKAGPDRAFHVYTAIASKQSVLERIYLRIEGGTFWVPNVKYVELKGSNPATREPVVERFQV